jgi:hypothetical protein
LTGVTSHGLSCEVCKYKVHKRCSTKAINNCKWTTLASIGKDIIEDQDGVSILQYLYFHKEKIVVILILISHLNLNKTNSLVNEFKFLFSIFRLFC